MRKRGAKAWLVTWEWSGEHAKPDDKVLAILDPRWSAKKVREHVELMYAQATYSLGERIAWCVRNPNQNPYPAKFISLEGVPWEGEIHCGHNPYLLARQVENLEVARGEDGKETATWKDRYSANEMQKKIAAMKIRK